MLAKCWANVGPRNYKHKAYPKPSTGLTSSKGFESRTPSAANSASSAESIRNAARAVQSARRYGPRWAHRWLGAWATSPAASRIEVVDLSLTVSGRIVIFYGVAVTRQLVQSQSEMNPSIKQYVNWLHVIANCNLDSSGRVSTKVPKTVAGK